MPAHVRPAQPGDPARVGPYRIVGRLGAGSMGTVHAALAPDGTRVAVKVVHPAQAADPDFRARFRREVELSRRVAGLCLVPVLDADVDAERPWLATAYVPGPTLAEHLAARGPLAAGALYAFATGTAAALAAVHAAGVVHRDVKPQNVILAASGPRVLDFGIAHAVDGTSVTRTGVMTGTPGWISPEHYRTGAAGPQGDVFAWGALAAYAATVRHPFGTGAPDAVAFRVLSEEPDLAGVPAPLAGLVSAALAKDPDGRPTAAELSERCAALLAEQDTQVADAVAAPTRVADLVEARWEMPTIDDTVWALPRRSRPGVLIAASAVAALAGVVAGAALLAPALGDKNPSAGPAAASVGPSAVASPATASANPTPTAPAGAAATATTTDSAPPTNSASAPSPAYTRTDDAEPSIEEWAAARDAATTAEQATADAIRKANTEYLQQEGMPGDPAVTFNADSQTFFVTFGPSPGHGYDTFYGPADASRSVAFTTCHAANQLYRHNAAAWPYGRYAVVYQESMATPAITLYGETINATFCRV